MNTKNMILSVVAAIFVVIGASVSQAQVVINDHATGTEIADHFSANAIIGSVEFRPDNTSDWDLRASSSGSAEDTSDFTWTRNVSYGFNIAFDGAGNLEFTLSPPTGSPTTVSVGLTDWFSGGVMQIETPGFVNIQLSGNIAGSSFDDLVSTQGGGSDAFIFELPGYNSGNQPAFSLNATMDLNSPVITNGSFYGRFDVTQVPEPSSILLLLLSGLGLGNWASGRAEAMRRKL